jgi:uncharacterized lipoprotein
VIIRHFIIILSCAFLFGCGSTYKDSPSSTNEIDPIRGNPKALDADGNTQVDRKAGKKPAKAQVYQVKTNKPLDVPPELITTTNDTVLQNIEESAEQQVNILPEVVDARIIKEDDGTRWLEIDTRVEDAWKAVTEYWSLGGVNLVDYNPEAGVMETQWIEQLKEIDEGTSMIVEVTKTIFSSLTKTNTSVDKYRVRFERLSKEQTALYISHRSIARKEKYYSKKVSDFEWVELESNPEKEAALLQNLVLLFDQSGK